MEIIGLDQSTRDARRSRGCWRAFCRRALGLMITFLPTFLSATTSRWWSFARPN